MAMPPTASPTFPPDASTEAFAQSLGQPAREAFEDLRGKPEPDGAHEFDDRFAVEFDAARGTDAIDHLCLHGHDGEGGHGLREQLERAADDGVAQDHGVGFLCLRGGGEATGMLASVAASASKGWVLVVGRASAVRS
jgi:hypothetical protein